MSAQGMTQLPFKSTESLPLVSVYVGSGLELWSQLHFTRNLFCLLKNNLSSTPFWHWQERGNYAEAVSTKSTRKIVLPWSVRKFQSKFSHFLPIRCNLCAAIRVGQQPHFSTEHFLKLANVDLNETQPCLSYWLRLIKDTKIYLPVWNGLQAHNHRKTWNF